MSKRNNSITRVLFVSLFDIYIRLGFLVYCCFILHLLFSTFFLGAVGNVFFLCFKACNL